MGCYSENVVLAPEEALLLGERGGHGGEGVVCKLTGKYIDCQCGSKKRVTGKKRDRGGCCFCVERARKTLLIRCLIREQKGSERVCREGI